LLSIDKILFAIVLSGFKRAIFFVLKLSKLILERVLEYSILTGLLNFPKIVLYRLDNLFNIFIKLLFKGIY